jgi:hypothetical protein
MIWSLDMDDFSGKLCRKNRKKALKRFPLVNAMKQEFEREEEETTTVTMLPTTTSLISNETRLSSKELQDLLDQMFDEASASLIKIELFDWFLSACLPLIIGRSMVF